MASSKRSLSSNLSSTATGINESASATNIYNTSTYTHPQQPSISSLLTASDTAVPTNPPANFPIKIEQEQEQEQTHPHPHQHQQHQQDIPEDPQSSKVASDSRRHSASSMRTSTPYEGPPSITPTGRISKAKKGKRVHTCEFPGCGKVFSRAEHRRRHELNHNPEALFRCDRAGCRKSFHRSDLLQRHSEKQQVSRSPRQNAMFADMIHSDFENGIVDHTGGHLRTTSSNSDTLPMAPGCGSSLSDGSRMLPVTMASPSVPHNSHRPGSGGVSIPDIVHPNNYAMSSISFSPYGRPAVPYLAGFPSPETSSFYTPRSSRSPAPELYPYYPRPRGSSTSSVTGIDTPLLQPELSGSWMSGPPSVLPTTMFDESFDSCVPVCPPLPRTCFLAEADQTSSSTEHPVQLPLSNLDEHEWSAINRELSGVPGIQPTNDAHGLSDTIRWYCLDYYWQYFHPFFPVVHRPTFLPTKPSPLLASAMIAIGSYYDKRPDARLYTLTLLEVATKLLRRRDNITSRSRLVDLQTVFLLEALSKYCSRRIEIEMSSRFRSLYASLNQARQTLTTNPLAVLRTLRSERTAEDLRRAHKFWIEHETRRRILQASMVLDMQQVTMFEQPATIIQHNAPQLNLPNLRSSIGLPCSEDLWNTSPVEEWAGSAAIFDYADITSSNGGRYGSETVPLDYFQAQIQMASDKGGLLQIDPQIINSAVSASSNMFRPLPNGLSSPDEAPNECTRFSQHAFSMAKNTPIRDLLVVSGESWLFGRKLESETDFQAAKLGLRKWISFDTVEGDSQNGKDSITALWHAICLLRDRLTIIAPPADLNNVVGVKFISTNMLHESWCLYLAALICWAHGFCASLKISSNTGSASSSNPISPTPSSTTATTNMNSPHSRIHPSLIDSVEAAKSVQDYLRTTNVASSEELKEVDPVSLAQFQGLLEVVRLQKIGSAMGGLMNEAERVLYRLVEGRNRLSHF